MSDRSLERYDRQMRFAPIGEAGQRRLAAATVLIVGSGALGTALAEHMTRAGVGVVRLADRDYVEPSNLQRQGLFDEADAAEGPPKAGAAAAKLRRMNGSVRIEPHVTDVTARNAALLARGADLVLDGTDNAAARLALSDACFGLGIPYVYGGVTGASGMSATFVPGATACLRCTVGGESELAEGETCETAGIIAPIVELVAAVQAGEAMQWLVGAREAMRGTWLAAELWPFAVRETRMPRPVRSCAVCGAGSAGAAGVIAAQGSTLRSAEQEDGWGTAVLCGRDSVQVTLAEGLALLEPDTLEEQLQALGCRTERNPYLLRAWTADGLRLVIFPEGRVLVQGTSDAARARAACIHYLIGREAIVHHA